MSVPFIDFSEQYNTIKDDVNAGFAQIFSKSNFILGEEEKQFEKEFAGYCDSKYSVGVNSGTDALYLSLSALDVTIGDEVILPAFTFIATALCVSYTGAKPVFVDVEEATYNIDPTKLEDLITEKTKAIIPVHLYGQPANMNEINAIAKKHNIAVVEDAAQSHGATYGGKKVGALGDISCFSFYPTKALGGCGDGGMVVTNNEKIYNKVNMLRDYGRSDRYNHKIKGYNSRLDTIQAVYLSAKLKHLDKWNQARNGHAKIYNDLLKTMEGVITPTIEDKCTHVFQTFAVRVPNRDNVAKQMQDNGIGVLIHYPIPLHLQEAYADLGYKAGDFPISELLAQEELSLPMFPHMTRGQIEEVCETLKQSLGVSV